ASRGSVSLGENADALLRLASRGSVSLGENADALHRRRAYADQAGRSPDAPALRQHALRRSRLSGTPPA
ncbi:MAG: hypothetical protein L0099_14260, partial [Acidobacteria bacterium]|nr:hypothetical protein [Acidobacteriota bacterium]